MNRPITNHRASNAWHQGYEAFLAGLGDPCPYPGNSLAGIEWNDGWSVAERRLRFLEDE